MAARRCLWTAPAGSEAHRVLAARGGGALSVRAIATEMNLTGPALTHRWDNRARLWRLLTSEIGGRWSREAERAVRVCGPEGLLPTTAEAVEDTRLWQAMADLGRGDPDLSFRVADVAAQERGLRERLCSVARPMTEERAHEAWRAALVALLPATPTSPSTPGRRAGRAADA